MFELPARLDFKNIILSQLIDSLYRNRGHYESKLGVHLDAVKSLTGAVAHLRYEIGTDKPIRYLQPTTSVASECDDLASWNRHLSAFIKDSVDGGITVGKATTWHNLPWLFAECYLYRRIVESLSVNDILNFDPFAAKKQAGFNASKSIILCFLQYLSTVQQRELEPDLPDLKTFIEASLWANEFDLSLHPDMDKQEKASTSSELPAHLETLRPRLVVDDSDALQRIWLARRQSAVADQLTVGIVLDNAGPELVADLCLGEYALATGLASRVVFYPKRWPWFVSDVVPSDVTWLLESDDGLASLGPVGAEWACRWRSRVEEGTFALYTSSFWTLPCGYAQLKAEDPGLYAKLAASHVVIFKGDLNYRKLLDDRHWLPDRPEHKVEAFRAYQLGRPSPGDQPDAALLACPCADKAGPGEVVHCRCPVRGGLPPLVAALRIAKADVAVGLSPSMWSGLTARSADWWTCGQFGMVQVVSPLRLDS